MAFSRLFCRRRGPGGDYCVTVRSGKLVLTLPNDHDSSQLWYKEDYSKYNGFMLVNKASNKVVRHAGVGDQLYLVEKPCYLDTSVRWTESQDLGSGFRSFRSAGNAGLGMDAWNGHIFDGTLVSVYPNSVCNGLGENAQWKLVHVPAPAPAPAPPPPHVYIQPSNMIYCLAGDAQYSVAIKAGKIVLVNPNPKDSTQHWYKDDCQNTNAGGFMLVNKATLQVVKQCSANQPLQLVNRPSTPDRSVLWTVSANDDYGFIFVMTANDSGSAMTVQNVDQNDHKGTHTGNYLSYSKNLTGDYKKWKFIPY